MIRFSPETIAALAHPGRLRILQALEGRELTAGELGELLPDIARATLYRHLTTLTDGNIVQVVAEHRVRGAVARTYALPERELIFPSAGVAAAPLEDRQAIVRLFAALVASDFERYLAGEVTLHADQVALNQESVLLDDHEVEQLNDAVRNLLRSFRGRSPGEGRRPRLVTYLALPDTRPGNTSKKTDRA